MQSWNISQLFCAVTIKIKTYFEMINCSAEIRFEEQTVYILSIFSQSEEIHVDKLTYETQNLKKHNK